MWSIYCPLIDLVYIHIQRHVRYYHWYLILVWAIGSQGLFIMNSHVMKKTARPKKEESGVGKKGYPLKVEIYRALCLLSFIYERVNRTVVILWAAKSKFRRGPVVNCGVGITEDQSWFGSVIVTSMTTSKFEDGSRFWSNCNVTGSKLLLLFKKVICQSYY